MAFVKTTPNQYLIVGRGGKVTNLGVAASAFLWPGSTYVLIPSTQQEATFEMTQESKDGIPLRFKGIVIYRVVDPLVAARLFDFSAGSGHETIKALISRVSLGELRALVSHMTMQECIEQRKTTLSETVAAALRHFAQGDAAGQSWGIELDVVQVAQVFIVDSELRRGLEAEVRNQIKSSGEISDLRMQEELQLAQIASQRRMQQQALETEKEKFGIEREKLHLQKEIEREKIEADVPIRLLETETRNRIKLNDDQSEIRLHEELKLAGIASERRLQQELLEVDKQKIVLEREKLRLYKESEREQLELRRSAPPATA